MPTASRNRQAVPKRPVQAPRRRHRPRISVHSALFVTLLAIAASLLIAAAQGPGTIETADPVRPTPAPVAIGDAAVRRQATPKPSTPSGGAGVDPSAKPKAPTSKRPEKLMGYHWPLSRKARITAFFDYRPTGFLSLDGRRFHEGLDMTTVCGDDVMAAHAGTVKAAGRRFGTEVGFSEPLDAFYAYLVENHRLMDLPIAVVIDDGNGYRSVYVHLRDATVKAGQKVKAGDVIGHIGATGNASGCHLHYELIRMDGGWMTVAKQRVKQDRYPPLVRERVDPLRVLDLRDRDAARIPEGLTPPEDPPRLTR